MSIFGDRGSRVPSCLVSPVPSLLDYVTLLAQAFQVFSTLKVLTQNNKKVSGKIHSDGVVWEFGECHGSGAK